MRSKDQQLLEEVYKRIQINERLILGRKETVTISKQPITEIKDTTSQLRSSLKPTGLWYGFGDGWIQYTKNEMPEGYFSQRKHAYKVYINKSKILSLNSDDELHSFVDTYKTRYAEFGHEEFGINWGKVGQKYSGIEMPRFEELNWRTSYQEYGKYYKFLHAWDISSGCVWRPDGVIKLRPL